jgi:sugar (pentulose or hexulose) kinase
VFGGMANTRLEEWMAEMAKRSAVLEKMAKDRNHKPDPAALAEVKRRNQEWAEIYTRSENACMEKTGARVPHAYGGV